MPPKKSQRLAVKKVRIKIGKNKYVTVHVKNMKKFIKDMKRRKIIA